MYANKIHYGTPTLELEVELFQNDAYKISFFKDSDLKYQQEYRIMLLNNLEEIDNEKKDHYIDCIGDISHISEKLNLNSLMPYNEDYYVCQLKNN